MTDSRISSLLNEALDARTEDDYPTNLDDVFDKVRLAKSAFELAILEIEARLANEKIAGQSMKAHHVGGESGTWWEVLLLQWVLKTLREVGAT